MVTLNTLLDREACAFSGRVGYALENLSTGQLAVRSETDWFPTASAVKLPILTAFHVFIGEGRVTWHDTVRIGREDAPPGSGILKDLDLPRELSYRDAAWLMICLSDNMATNVILHAMTLERTNELIRQHAGDGIEILRYIGQNAATPRGTSVVSMGRATPAALSRYLGDLARHRLPGAEATLTLAQQQRSSSGIPRYLPFDRSNQADLQIANKPGGVPGVRTDVAVITRGKTTVTMAIMIADAADTGNTFGNEGEKCIGRLARIAYDHWMTRQE